MNLCAGSCVSGSPLRKDMSVLDIKSFEQAELHSENVRVKALLYILGSLLVLVLVRGVASLIQDTRGEAWPFAIALVLMIGYEAVWLRFVRDAIARGRSIPRAV